MAYQTIWCDYYAYVGSDLQCVHNERFKVKKRKPKTKEELSDLVIEAGWSKIKTEYSTIHICPMHQIFLNKY